MFRAGTKMRAIWDALRDGATVTETRLAELTSPPQPRALRWDYLYNFERIGEKGRAGLHWRIESVETAAGERAWRMHIET